MNAPNHQIWSNVLFNVHFQYVALDSFDSCSQWHSPVTYAQPMLPSTFHWNVATSRLTFPGEVRQVGST